MMKNGFTLIEIIVVIAVMAILGVIITEIFIRSLQGSEKAKVLATIKQNGQAVLDVIDKTVRNSDNVVCPVVIPPTISASSNTIAVVKNGLYTRFRIKVYPTDLHILQDNPVPSSTSTQRQFLLDICTDLDYSGTTVFPITDTNTRTGVRVGSGSFTRQKATGYKDISTIQFTLIPGIDAGFLITSSIDPVEFKTSVELR